MDKKTIAAYDDSSAAYAKDWLEQPPPTDMYELLKKYFRPGSVLDVGCGVGRDVAWLNDNGFDAEGVDASEGLLSEARKTYPSGRFSYAALPLLAEIEGKKFQNVLCETVLMHLNEVEVESAITTLLKLLSPGGILYLSWRVTPGASIRDKKERLYSSFDSGEVLKVVEPRAKVLFDREDASASSGKVIHRLIVQRAENS